MVRRKFAPDNPTMNKKGRTALRWARYGLYLFVVVFILLEILLRIFDPFHFRIKGNKILLPVNQQITIRNELNPRLDREIVNTRNGIGFRGPEVPANMADRLSIITVGGSTTECYFLNDQFTWPYLTGVRLQKDFPCVWLNNAGLEGHSAFGHQVLLNDYLVQLKPKLITFLTGINDMENDAPTFHDKLNTRSAYPDLKHYLYNQSEVVNVAVNIFRGWRAQRFNNTTQALIPPKKGNDLALSQNQVRERLDAQTNYLEKYRKRIGQLIDTCQAHQIRPVFITQPCLYGAGTDSLTQANLATSRIGKPDGRFEKNMNGLLLWQLLELYNDVLRTECRDRNIPLIDLAALMPKNSLYFYDQVHFTNEGAREVAAVVADNLVPILEHTFPAACGKRPASQESMVK